MPAAPTATGCTSAVEGRTVAGGTAALGAAVRRHGVGASEVKGRPVVGGIGSCESIADAASGGGNSTGSSAGPAATRSIQEGRPSVPTLRRHSGARGSSVPLNDDCARGSVSPHLTTAGTTVSGAWGSSVTLNDDCARGPVSPHLTTAGSMEFGVRGSSVPLNDDGARGAVSPHLTTARRVIPDNGREMWGRHLWSAPRRLAGM